MGPKPTLYALSIVQAMKDSPSAKIVVGPDSPYLSRFLPSEHLEDRFDLIYMQFSLHDLSYRNETDSVVVSALTEIESGLFDPIPTPRCLFSRAVFNAKNQEWTQIHVRTSRADASLNIYYIESESRLSRAGRILVSHRHRESGERSFHLVAVDSLGELITARVTLERTSEQDESDREVDVAISLRNMEPSSGTLIRFMDSQARIRLYRPK